MVDSQAAPGVLLSKTGGRWLWKVALQMGRHSGSAGLTRCIPHLKLSSS